jgi:hypothetical protein
LVGLINPPKGFLILKYFLAANVSQCDTRPRPRARFALF